MREIKPSLRSLLIMTTLIMRISCLHHLTLAKRQRLHRISQERVDRIDSSDLENSRIPHDPQADTPKQSHDETEPATGLVNISPNSFKNNLRNLNWYYGSITPSEYRVRLFVAATKQNLSSCPYDRPYVKETDMQTCFQCPDMHPLYNLGIGECQACPDAELFDKYLGNCSAVANGTEPDNEQAQDNQEAQLSGEEGSGIKEILSEQTKQSEEQAKRQARQKIQQQGKEQQEKEQREQDELLSVEQRKQNQQQAAKQKKLEAEQAKIQAKRQAVRKQQQEAAVISQEEKDKEDEDQYKEEQQKNAQASSQQSIANGTAVDVDEGETNSQTEEAVNETYVYNCTSETPLFINNKCKSCPQLNEYFTEQNVCKPKIFRTNPNAKNIILPSWKYLQEQDLKIKKVNQGRNIYQCAIDNPYLINAKCQKCQDNFYYDASQQTCVNDCQEYTVYDKKLRMCVNGTFYTSPDSKNLLVSLQTVREYKAGVQQDMANRPFPEYCPQTAPFALGNKCVICHENKPYFSLDSLECQSCQAGRYYDSDKRKCVSSYDNSLSIDRMIMNII